MIMSRHAATGRRLQKKSRRAGVGIPVLERALQAFDIFILGKGRILERRDAGRRRLRGGSGGRDEQTAHAVPLTGPAPDGGHSFPTEVKAGHEVSWSFRAQRFMLKYSIDPSQL